MTTVKNFINGESLESTSGPTMPVVDPSTDPEYGTAPLSNEAGIDKA